MTDYDWAGDIDKLKQLNGALCAEVNALTRAHVDDVERIDALESLVRDMWAVIQRPYICVDVDVLHERMKKLKIIDTEGGA